MIDIIEKERCTIFNTVPTMLLAMIQQPTFTPEALSSLRVSALGGSATSESQMTMLHSLLPNNHFCNIYGMSENAVITITHYEDTFEHITQSSGFQAGSRHSQVPACIRRWIGDGHQFL